MNKATLNLALGAVLIGFAAPLARLIKIDTNWIGFLRCLTAAGILLLLLIIQNKGAFGFLNLLKVRGNKWLVFSGMVFGIDMFVWHHSIVNAGAGISTILGNTQVFYLAFLGATLNGEKLSMRFWTGLSVAIMGIYLLVGDLNVVQFPNYKMGVIYGLITGVVYATFTFCLSKTRSQTHGLGVLGRLFWILLSASFTIGILLIFVGHLPGKWESEFTLYLLCLAIGPQILGWYLITKSLPEVPISIGGLLLLIQPVVATYMGKLWFAEYLDPLQVLGGGLTLAAIFLANAKTP